MIYSIEGTSVESEKCLKTESDLTNRIANKMIRPTTIPQTLEALVIEQAIAREALRLSFEQHKEFAVQLKGVQQERTISDAFEQSGSGDTLVDLMKLDLLVGSGGVLSARYKLIFLLQAKDGIYCLILI